MNDGYEEELATEMRLAVTRATVAFPRINPTPITIAVYHAFSDVFHDLTRRHRWSVRRGMDPFDAEVVELMTRLVSDVLDQLAAKKAAGEVTAGISPVEAKKMHVLVQGLDTGAARQLIAFSQDPGNSPEQVRQKRVTMLKIRQNLLANNLAGKAVEAARKYYLNEVRSEPDPG